MADRTLLICAGLVIVALLLFAGTGLLLMYKGTPGNSPDAGSFQKNGEKMKSHAHVSPSEQHFQPDNNQEQGRMVKSQGQPGSRDDGVPCPMNHGNQGPGNAPGSGPEKGYCPMHHNKGGCHPGPAGHTHPGFDAKQNFAPHDEQKGFDQKGHGNSRCPCQSEQDNKPVRG